MIIQLRLPQIPMAQVSCVPGCADPGGDVRQRGKKIAVEQTCQIVDHPLAEYARLS